jgi:hypothetical protein
MFDINSDKVTPKWIYTAITRATEPSKISIRHMVVLFF